MNNKLNKRVMQCTIMRINAQKLINISNNMKYQKSIIIGIMFISIPTVKKKMRYRITRYT